jgi:lambda repressor-like predicted transcriptional regulator
MDTGVVRVSKPCEITADDLHDAYVFCRLRRIGIGMAKVIETPALSIALRNTAIARKAKQMQLNLGGNTK